MITNIGIIVLSLYFIFFVLIVIFQRKLQYHPHKKIEYPQDFNITMESTDIHGSDGHALWTWYKKPHAQKPVIVYFHGNAKGLGWRATRFEHYVKKGYGIVCATYRYNAHAHGKPSEHALVADGKRVLEWVEHSLHIPKHNTILYGESLGTGIAIQLAKGKQYKALVLEVPYDSMVSAAQHHARIFPVFKFLLRDVFDSKKHIKEVHIPVLIGGAERDKVVPVAQAYNLFACAHEPKKFVLRKNAGHTEMYNHQSWVHAVYEFCQS